MKMERLGLNDLKARKEELILAREKMKKECKDAEDEIENLTKIIQKEEDGRDWKTLSSEIIEQNNGFRNRIWELNARKMLLGDRIKSVGAEISHMSKLYSSMKSKEKTLEFDRELGLLVTSQGLKDSLEPLFRYLFRVSDEQLDVWVLNQKLREALKSIRSLNSLIS